MTDPRIEAAVSEWMRQIDKISLEKTGHPAKWTDPEILSGIRNAMTASLAAADAAAWRHVKNTPPENELVQIMAHHDGDDHYAIAQWDYAAGYWHNPELGIGYSPFCFTHWMPLPAPPTDEVLE